MKKIILILLFFICFKSFGQTDCKDGIIHKCGKMKAVAGVNTWLANKRLKVFRKYKGPALAKALNKKELDSIIYSRCGFLRLLQNVVLLNTDSTEKYDGLRVYFGETPDSLLTLIFSPTTSGRHTSNGDLIHNDATYWLITGDNPQSLTKAEAGTLIMAYNGVALNPFTDDGKKHLHYKKYQETKSLWYDISMIEHRNSRRLGLVDYLQCLINNDKVDYVVADFGGFLLKHKYQLTLVFDFRRAGTFKNNYVYLSLPNDSRNSTGRTDTGVPCPPPPTGETVCPGTLQ